MLLTWQKDIADVTALRILRQGDDPGLSGVGGFNGIRRVLMRGRQEGQNQKMQRDDERNREKSKDAKLLAFKTEEGVLCPGMQMAYRN